MGAPRNANATNGSVSSPGRELFGTRIGFVLAAAGSAVGLGNMWRFPYQTAEGGGAAFVLVYLFMTFLIGVPLMVAEFAVGRRTRLAPIGALRTIGGRGWTPFGFVLVATPLLLLSYFSVVSGWSLRYAVDALRGFSTSPGERYAEISHGFPAVQFHLVLMAVTIGIVMGGSPQGDRTRRTHPHAHPLSHSHRPGGVGGHARWIRTGLFLLSETFTRGGAESDRAEGGRRVRLSCH